MLDQQDTQSLSPHSNQTDYPTIFIYLFTVLYIFSLIIQLIRLDSSRKRQENGRKSLDDIRGYVQAKIMMDTEDKKLTKLLESVIPKHLAGRMREDILLPQNKGNFYSIYLDSYDNVSILFADIVNFTKISSACSAQLLVETLNELFGRFDKAADKNHCLRIKILGDCYYCVSGIPDQNDQHAIRSVEMGLDMIEILGELKQDNSGVDLNMRVGIHSGRALCGVMGKKKWQYDVHSNDVKLANHCEQSGIPGRVHITEDTLKALNGRFSVEPANGHLRDAYIAQLNISTYFVITPPERRKSFETTKLILNPAFDTSLVSSRGPFSLQPAPSIASVQAHPAVAIALSTATAVHQQQLEAPTEVKRSSSGSIAAQLKDPLQPRRSVSIGPQLPQQQAGRLRFKMATQRIINALHFIRTIDAPFANLEAPTMNADRVMHETILSRTQTQDIHPYTLVFKDSRIGRLYEANHGPTALRYFILHLIAFTCLAIYSTQSEFNIISIVTSLSTLLALICLVFVRVHQNELKSKKEFLWRQLAMEDKDRMAQMRNCNKFIFFNLLPPHVASYFLEQRVGYSHTDLYHKSYDRIGVLFATISNFSDFYSEVQGNNHGLECLRVLNEIICDFDSILDDERFKAVDKIKTIGSTYMAAIGLFPDYELPSEPIELPAGQSSDRASRGAIEMDSNEQDVDTHRGESVELCDEKRLATRCEVARYLQILIRFVFEMKARLQEINKHSFNCFKLRVGINLGPVTAGVIGASKPQYDIWGNTVNVASRMESTAESNKIQITEDVYRILADFNDNQKFKFTCRGSINVKGKGHMTTYYLDE